MRIIETDNFDGDYPDQKFVELPPLPDEAIEQIAEIINKHCSGPTARRFWRTVPDDHKLVPGFEP